MANVDYTQPEQLQLNIYYINTYLKPYYQIYHMPTYFVLDCISSIRSEFNTSRFRSQKPSTSQDTCLIKYVIKQISFKGYKAFQKLKD